MSIGFCLNLELHSHQFTELIYIEEEFLVHLCELVAAQVDSLVNEFEKEASKATRLRFRLIQLILIGNNKTASILLDSTKGKCSCFFGEEKFLFELILNRADSALVLFSNQYYGDANHSYVVEYYPPYDHPDYIKFLTIAFDSTTRLTFSSFSQEDQEFIEFERRLAYSSLWALVSGRGYSQGSGNELVALQFLRKYPESRYRRYLESFGQYSCYPTHFKVHDDLSFGLISGLLGNKNLKGRFTFLGMLWLGLDPRALGFGAEGLSFRSKKSFTIENQTVPKGSRIRMMPLVGKVQYQLPDFWAFEQFVQVGFGFGNTSLNLGKKANQEDSIYLIKGSYTISAGYRLRLSSGWTLDCGSEKSKVWPVEFYTFLQTSAGYAFINPDLLGAYASLSLGVGFGFAGNTKRPSRAQINRARSKPVPYPAKFAPRSYKGPKF